MRKLFVTGVVFVYGTSLRADFTYQQTCCVNAFLLSRNEPQQTPDF